MSEGYFDAPVFIKERHETTVDISKTPYFYNDEGRPTYVEKLPNDVTPLVPAATDPRVAIGREYVVSEVMGRKADAALWCGNPARLQ